MRALLRLVATVSVAAVCMVAAALTAPASSTGVTMGTSSFQQRCGFWRTATIPVDWYAPAGSPKALVYVQHGWLGSSRQMRDLALAFASDGYLVVAPSISSVSLSCGVNSEGFIRSLGPALADGTIVESGRRALGARWPGEPERIVVAGHSIGAAIVSLVGADSTVRDRVALAIHLDGVESRGGYLHKALQADTATPILQITAPPSRWNAENSGPRVVATFRPGGSYDTDLDGAQVSSGTHCDPLGSYPLNPCGSTAQNQRAFFDLSVSGANQTLGQPGPRFDDVSDRLGGLVHRLPSVGVA